MGRGNMDPMRTSADDSSAGRCDADCVRYGLLFLLIAIPLAALVAYQAYASYRMAYKDAQSEAGNLSLVLESKAHDILQRTEATVADMAAAIEGEAMRQASTHRHAARITAELKTQLLNFRQVAVLRYFDAAGTQLYSSEAGEGRGSIADQAFFQKLRSDPAVPLAFSAVLPGPRGQATLYLGKPVRDAQGTFLGLAQAGIDLTFSHALLRQIDIGADGVAALRRLDDGALVVRVPGPVELDNKPMLDCPMRKAILQGVPAGTIEATCLPDNPARVYAYRAVNGYPFFVYVGLAGSHYLAAWRKDAAVAAGAAILVLLVIGLTFWRLARSEARRRRAEAELQENAKRLYDIVAASGDWIWEVDAAGRYTYASDGVRDLIGHAPEDVVGKTPFDFMPPEEAQRVGAEFAAIAARREPFRDLANVNVRKDGSLRQVETSGMPILDDHGNLLGYRGLDKDVTERVAAERALQESQATLSAVFQSSPAGIYVTRVSDGHLVDVNEAFLALYGARRDEVIGKTTLEMNVWGDHPERRAELIEALQREGLVRDFEVMLHRRSGEPGVGLVSAKLIKLDGEKYIVGAVVDITERKRLADELKLAKDRQISALTVELERRAIAAEAATHAKSQFLANMSHEFRTPLNAIMGFGQILLRRNPTPDQQAMLTKLLAASQEVLVLLNQVLELAGIDDGNLAVKNEAFEFDLLIRKVAEEAARRAAARHLAFTVEMDVVPRALRGDADRLGMLLHNYLDNAFKFTETGAVTLRGRVLEEGADDVLLRFEVEDTGIGIAPEHLAQIFEPFELVDGSFTRCYRGAGLGLAINQRLARLLGGEVGVVSTSGVGSVFWATARLQKIPASPAAEAAVADAEEMLRQRHHGSRILVVDDEAVNCEILDYLLSRAGLSVDMAEDGALAVENVRTRSYDLILMDMQMPRMGGLQATEVIRGMPGCADIPIVAVTANSSDKDRQACLAAGMNDFLAKPVDADLLMATLLKWLQRGR